MNWETIICLGDSITIGARSMLGYPEYCGNSLSELTNKHWHVINHATSGYKTIDLCRCVTNNFANLKSFKPDVISIMIGTNDLKTKTNYEDFRIAYEQLIIKARLILGNNEILLLKIPQLMEGVMRPYKIQMNNEVGKYNEIIEEISKKEGLSLHSMESTEDDFYDGVHLNDKGSKRWGKMLADYIFQLRSVDSVRKI